ncbi:SRPBCC family protein [Streptomyces sp. ITFR-16]|uniref:SRPBCC family protein n=1 Tax=Streptomyces sp. ITFR-16 TaxID=3075198 RepID=UPI00288A777B|nr:SRPBCC family protein [Streptomyces sp. ITFR-16]WNI26303.1 SRPBCC family protein [Streptomyces sp. ITFR-16]
MARRLRSVGLDFVGTAPLRLVFAAEVSAPPDAVYRALADDVEGWPGWFTGVTAAVPADGGAGRAVRLRGGVVFRETVVAAEPAERYAYRIDSSNAPGLRALVEEWRLTPAGTGTRVRWTFAADGTPVFRFALRRGRAVVGRSFRDAMRSLDRRLTAAPA